MANDKQHFPLHEVRAWRAYFEQRRRSAKGTPAHNDLELTVKLADELIALMEEANKRATAT